MNIFPSILTKLYLKFAIEKLVRITPFRLKRWEPVFQGEREKLISDRARDISFVINYEKRNFNMNKSKRILKMVVLSMLIALGVVISPILRFEGMCPMAHFINIVCSVFLGPWYSLLCAFLIGVIRMSIMGIPPIALTGAIFGAFLSGVFYRLSKGKLLFAVLGEIIGTGIIGAVLSYPVMTIFWGKEGLTWLFYVPSFVCGTLIGGSIAFVFLKKLSNSGMISKIQNMLSSKAYTDNSGVISEALSIAAFGVICFMVIRILTNIFKMYSPIWSYMSYSLLAIFCIWSIVYYVLKKVKNIENK